MSKKLVFSWGRMNPVTVGHQKLADKVKAIAKHQNADSRIYLSHTQNKKKDPLDYNSKIKYAMKAFGSIVTKSNSRTIIQIMKELQDAGYTDVTLVVGSDRIPEFKKLLTRYNGKDYTFNSINIQSAGERDPDAEGVEGMSASKMRALAKEGNFTSFKSGLPKSLYPIAKEIYDKLRNILEEDELEESVLTLQQRQKRSRTMKRLSKKLHRKRQVAKKRMADSKKLQKRALKKAREVVRKKVAGEKGLHYDQLSSTQKIAIDKMVEKKKPIIAKIAKKLMPKVRKSEMERLKKERSSRNEQREILSLNGLTEMNQDKDTKVHGKKYKNVFSEKIDPRREPNLYRAQQSIDREKDRDLKKFDRMRDTAKVRDQIYKNKKESVLEKSIATSLSKKSEKSGIPYETLKEVYDRGMVSWCPGDSNSTQQQWAFARVNSYIAKGTGTYYGDDKDLHAELDLEEGITRDFMRKVKLSLKMKNLLRWYLDWRRKNPKQGYQGVVKALKIAGFDPSDANKLVDFLNNQIDQGNLPKHLAIVESVSPEKSKKRFKDILPKSGAGQECTDELSDTYKKDTPGQVQGSELDEIAPVLALGTSALGLGVSAIRNADRQTGGSVTHTTRTKTVRRPVREESEDLTESYVFAKDEIRIQGGFAHHPSVIDQMESEESEESKEKG